MKYLLDTNVCIRYLNGQSDDLRHRLESKLPEEIALCSVVKAELLYGVVKSAKPEKNLERLSYFLMGFQSLPFDDNSVQVYAEVRAELERAGKPIGPNDLLIASIALANQLILVTHNTREFSRIKGLSLEDWQARDEV
jgi:tRNA(fMet)-specific endonuclease VapC